MKHNPMFASCSMRYCYQVACHLPSMTVLAASRSSMALPLAECPWSTNCIFAILPALHRMHPRMS